MAEEAEILNKYLVHHHPYDGPATHAMVIGVGAYTHLPGGDGPEFPEHEGMKQLSSPPVSARAIANWLVTEFNHSKPLASLSLLISEENPDPWKHPRSGADFPLQPVTMDHLRQAVRHWKSLGDSHKDNMMLLFFSGHGIARGTETFLLPQDFGSFPADPLENAWNFSLFQAGMEQCKARRQCFFIDACRVNSQTALEVFQDSGESIIAPRARRNDGSEPRFAPVFYATLLGDAAYGRKGKPSLFAEALLKVLKGYGADDSEGEWRIETNAVQKAIQFFMEKLKREGHSFAPINPTDSLVNFDLHHMQKIPDAFAVVSCRPEEATGKAVLSCESPTVSHKRVPPEEQPWEISVEAGEYDFKARFDDGTFQPQSKKLYVRPPYKKIPLGVTP